MKIRASLVLAVTALIAASVLAVATPGASAVPPPPLPSFYTVPSPLPAGAPGDVIASEIVAAPGLHGTMWRVMYHSQSIDGTDIAVTGLIASPNDSNRHDIVTWAHGTTGIADMCAPSLDPANSEMVALANALLDKGDIVTATDYEGMGTPGRHPYIAGVSEGRGTIDIVRAAGRMPELHASADYIIWGHSQGGHAAMFAGHIAPAWAPELTLKGVVAGAPPSQLLLINAALQTSPFKYYIAMAAAGLNAAYGDARLPLGDVLTDAGLEWLNNVDEGCTAHLAAAAVGVDFSTLQKADPATVPAWRAALSENDPGTFTEPIDAPLLIIHGGADEQIPVVASKMMFDSLCGVGQVETRWVLPGQSHAGVIVPSAPAMLDWMGARFAGDPVSATAAPDSAQVETCGVTTATPVAEVVPSFTG